MKPINIGISIGDINGIGLEVVLKTLAHEQVLKMCTPIIYGSSKVVSYHKNIAKLDQLRFSTFRADERLKNGRIYVVNCWDDEVSINLGQITEDGGKYATLSLSAAVEDLSKGLIDGLVTAPINKEAMKLSGFPYPGHTEFLTDKLGEKNNLMTMVQGDLRIALVTNHEPIEQVKPGITKERIKEKLKIFEQSLIRDFGIEKPSIAIMGLNPHAGDGGAIGKEEEDIIRPLIIEAKKKGKLFFGPYSADGFFGSGNYKKFDGILAMYHDQGLIPFKLLSFGNGVNYTAGLPFVRTSPDHGTGHDIAGKNLADPGSFKQALFQAIDLIRNRADYKANRENAMTVSSKK